MERNYTSIRLEITSKCNLNCKYCHNSLYNNSEDDMSTEEIIKLVKKLNERNKIKKILLTGGEPLLNRDVCKIISTFTSMGIKLDMVTNGTLITEKYLKELEKAGLKRIRLSIDSIDDSVDTRDKANISRLWQIAKLITEKSNIELAIHTVCSPANVDNLYDVYKKLLEVKAARWRVFDIGYQGNLLDNKKRFDFADYYQKMILSTKKILNDYLKNGYYDRLDIEINNVFKTSFLYLDAEKNSVDISKVYADNLLLSPCEYVADHQLTVRSNGCASLCQYFRNSIYEFKKNNMDIDKSFFNKNHPIENELIKKDLNYCPDCKYFLVCNGGCRSKALYLTNDIKEPDPTSCCLHKLIDEELMPILPENVRKWYNNFILNDKKIPKYNSEKLTQLLLNKGFNHEYEYRI